MIERCAQPGELQSRIQHRWFRLFTPPPPPTYIPKEVFMAKMKDAIEARFRDTTAAVEKLRARGGKIVFVRLPVSGELKALEDRITPRSQIWDRVIKDTGAPGIYFEDFPELSGFNCPEWSHLFRWRLRRIQQTPRPSSSQGVANVSAFPDLTSRHAMSPPL